MSEVKFEVKTYEIKYECDEGHCREWQVAKTLQNSDQGYVHSCFAGHTAVLDRKYPYTKTVKV